MRVQALLEKSIGPRGPGGEHASSFMLRASPKCSTSVMPRMLIIMSAFFKMGEKKGECLVREQWHWLANFNKMLIKLELFPYH